MSHIHHLSNSANAGAEYQDYLERLRARKTPLRSFDSAIEAERESEGREPEEQPDAESRAKQDPEPNPEPEPEAKRYA
jgi:hypothetical protein